MADEPLNLTLPRGDKSVWDEPTLTSRLSNYDRERWAALACGAALTSLGVRRRGIVGGMLAAAGTTLSVRALMGRRDLRVARNWIDQQMRVSGWRPHDIVTTTSEESFPASDPPSWTPTI